MAFAACNPTDGWELALPGAVVLFVVLVWDYVKGRNR